MNLLNLKKKILNKIFFWKGQFDFSTFWGGFLLWSSDILLRSLCLDEASEEVDEDDAEDEGEDVHNEEGEGPPVQAGHHKLTGEK